MKLLYALIIICFAFSNATCYAVDELTERRSISDAVVDALQVRDFKKLEEMSQTYRRDQSRTASGVWKLSVFYAGIDVAIHSAEGDKPKSYQLMEDKIKSWTAANPTSPAAHIALSLTLIQHGWYFRRNRRRNAVNPEA